MNKFFLSMAVAVAFTGASMAAGLYYGWITEVNWLEVAAVFTSYSCTFLCVVQSRQNYIHGVVTVALYTVLFYQAGLYASAALNAYLFPTLAWGWFRWGRDDDTRPVMLVELKWWPAYLGLTGVVWYALSELATYIGGTLPFTDSAILVGSILAQFLLDQKKIETWVVWFVVDVFAVYTYYEAGYYLVALQFFFFLLNTFWGAWSWYRTMESRSVPA